MSAVLQASAEDMKDSGSQAQQEAEQAQQLQWEREDDDDDDEEAEIEHNGGDQRQFHLQPQQGGDDPNEDDDGDRQQVEQDEPLSQQQMALLAHRYSTRPAQQSGDVGRSRGERGDDGQSEEEEEEDDVLVDAPSAAGRQDDDDSSSSDSADYTPAIVQPPKVERTQSGRTVIRARRPPPRSPAASLLAMATESSTTAAASVAADGVNLTARQKRKREVDSEKHQTAIASIRARRGQQSLLQPDSTHSAHATPPRPAASRRAGKPSPSFSLAASFASLSSASVSPLQPPQRHGWEVDEALLASELFVVDGATDAGMTVPAELELEQLTALMDAESELPVRVVDASTQRAVSDWTLGRWQAYWRDAAGSRGELGQPHQAATAPAYEMQLQLSEQAVLDVVKRPAVIEDLDRLTAVWRETQQLQQPAAASSSSSFPACAPRVQLYCIASAAGAWRDFSLPLAGSGSWHHVVSGSRTFCLLRTDSTTLRLYEEWHAKRLQWTTSLLQFITSHPAYAASASSSPAAPLCRSVTVRAGETLFMPPGQLRACLSPSRSLLLCGHYLLTSAGSTLVQVDAIGKRCPTARCRFPWLRFVLWLLADAERKRLTLLDEREQEGLGAIVGALAVACRERRDAAAPQPAEGRAEDEDEEATSVPYANGEDLLQQLMLQLRLLTLQREKRRWEEAKRAIEEQGRRRGRKETEELEEAERSWQRTSAYMDRLQQELARYDAASHDYRPLKMAVQQSTWLLWLEEKSEAEQAVAAEKAAIAEREELELREASPQPDSEDEAAEEEEAEEEDAEQAATNSGSSRRKRVLEDDDDWQAEDEPEAADDDDAWDANNQQAGDRQTAHAARRGRQPPSKKRRTPTKVKAGASARGRPAGKTWVAPRQRPALPAPAAAAVSAPPVSVAAKLSATLLSGLGGVGGVSSGSSSRYGKYALPGQGRSSQLMNMKKMRRSIKTSRQQDGAR